MEECEALLSELGSGSGVEETTPTDRFRYCAAATGSPPGVAFEAGSGGEDVGGAQNSDPGEYAYFGEAARPGQTSPLITRRMRATSLSVRTPFAVGSRTPSDWVLVDRECRTGLQPP